MSQSSVGLIFSVYLVGIVSSPVSGAVASRLGLRNVFWVMILIMGAGVALTGAASIVLIVAGLAVMTFGFFGAHSIASSWVGRRARTAKAQAASLMWARACSARSAASSGSAAAGAGCSPSSWPSSASPS